MAHLVKTKVSILSCAVLVIVLITAVRANFYRRHTIKRWDAREQLSWDDFNGIPEAFGPYGAKIQSHVYLEYDSLEGKYNAYAGQNDMRSWTKLEDDYGLKHEQYHFNITELHARKLNAYLSAAEGLTMEAAVRKLEETNRELSVFQARYDRETDHSLLTAKQHYWEFKVDSSLQEFSADKGILTDPFSGISASFYRPVQHLSGVNGEQLAYRAMAMQGYGMSFAIAAYQYVGMAKDDFEEYCVRTLKNDTTLLIANGFTYKEQYAYYDEVRLNEARTRQFWDRLFQYGNEAYLARVEAPYDSLNPEYEQIKDSFFNSIQFADTYDYWIRKAAGEGERLSFNYTSPDDTSGQREAICVSTDADNVFFKPPFLDEEQNLYIVYDIVAHPEDSVYYNVALINRRQVFDWKVDSAEQFIKIPNSFLPVKSFELEFGYVLKQDSLEACYHLYKQSGVMQLP